jgi:cytochrome bd-type quinol oxidase subunit 1
MRFHWRVPISLRTGGTIFAGCGVLLLAYAAYSGYRGHVALSTWPRVQARVDSGSVVAWEDGSHRQALYAERMWLRYVHAGRAVARPVTASVYTSRYGAAVRAVRQATQSGSVPVMLDPRDTSDVTLNPGYSWRYFFTPLVTGGLGFFFVAFGLTFWILHRRAANPAPGPSAETSRRHAIVLLLVMGVAFVAVATIAVVAMRGRQSTWITAQARIDSTDIVWKKGDSDRQGSDSDMYAVRAWLTYSLGGTEYHAPLTSTVSRSDSVATARRAEEEARRGTLAVLIDPNDPYALMAVPATALGLLWLPGVFAAIGLILLGIAAWLLARRRDGRGGANPARQTVRDGRRAS